MSSQTQQSGKAPLRRKTHRLGREKNGVSPEKKVVVAVARWRAAFQNMGTTWMSWAVHGDKRGQSLFLRASGKDEVTEAVLAKSGSVACKEFKLYS